MILEDALSSRNFKTLITKKDAKALQAFRFKARRFVFDDEASRAAGRFSTECADLVCENAEFALAPFDDTYLEIDLRASLAASSRVPLRDDAAERVGFCFMADGDVYVVSGSVGKWADFTPFRYRRREGNIDVPRDAYLRDMMVGEVVPDLRDRVDEFAHKMTDIWEMGLLFDMPEEIRRAIEGECRGQLKRALAALLLLNQKRTALRSVPPGRRITRGKMRTYMAHSVVSIDLGNSPIRKAFKVDHRATPRRHEVRGHFVHYGIEDNCSHQWESFADPELEKRDLERIGRIVPRWKCASCGGLRVRREAFARGDAGKGFVTKTYEVKKSPGPG